MKTARIIQPVALALLLCFSLSVAGAADQAGISASKTGPGTPEFKEGELLVKFHPGVSSGKITRAQSRIGLKTLKHYSNVGVYRLGIENPALSVKVAAKLLSMRPEVLYAEPNYRLSIAAVPDDPRFAELWGLNNTGQTGGTADADIDAPEAWDITTGSSDIVVAVIDTGVDYTHADLAANMWMNPGETPGNGEDDDGNGYIDDVYGIDAVNNDSDPDDDHSHGTHCSGTIGGVGDNGVGVAGVNWSVKIMALKFLDASGSGLTDDAIECVDYAVMMKTTYGVNLKLTSNSWGGGGFSQALKDAIEASGNAGMLFIAAAGNDGLDNDLSPHYPSSYDLAGIIAVAATDHNDQLASFSCYGATSVDLAAPGVDILSTTPSNTYALKDGTSMATPHVAGAAALLWASDPALGNMDVKDILLAEADLVPALAGKMVSEGRLNVFNAITCDPDAVDFAVSLEAGFLAEFGTPLTLSARLRACGLLRGATVTAEFSNGDPAISLTDDGVAPDAAADDGVYTGSWTPNALGAVTVTFTALHDSNTYIATATSNVVVFLGYYYDDTAPFNWIDISGTGTPLNLSDDDHAYLSLPFQVSFYDTDYDHIAVGSNGHIYFQDTGSDFTNDCIPAGTAYGADAFIAGFWDDLDPGAGGQIYFEVQGTAPERMVIVQYNNVPHYFSTDSMSFEIVMYEDSDDILMQYADVNFGDPALDLGASATVGVQLYSSYGQQYSCFESALSDQQAILWYRQTATAPMISLSTNSLSNSCQRGSDAPEQSFEVWNSGIETLSYSIGDDVDWLGCVPTGGTSTGEHDSITVNYTTSGLSAGAYSATIAISDPDSGNSPQNVIVSLTVIPLSYTLTTSTLPPDVGWVTGGGTYNEGASATVLAVADGDWIFDHWEGADIAGSTQNPEYITMDADKSVTAVFVPQPLSRITLIYPGDGAVLFLAPTFDWSADAGANNAFKVDMALSLSGPVYSSPLTYHDNWTIPTAPWNKVPSGTYVYWRVRGADLDHEPLTIITSDEVRGFFKY